MLSVRLSTHQRGERTPCERRRINGTPGPVSIVPGLPSLVPSYAKGCPLTSPFLVLNAARFFYTQFARPPKATYFISRYSSSPCLEPSRP